MLPKVTPNPGLFCLFGDPGRGECTEVAQETQRADGGWSAAADAPGQRGQGLEVGGTGAGLLRLPLLGLGWALLRTPAACWLWP